jgi:hypothetical protein
MEIEDDGRVVATAHKSVFSPLHHRGPSIWPTAGD